MTTQKDKRLDRLDANHPAPKPRVLAPDFISDTVQMVNENRVKSRKSPVDFGPWQAPRTALLTVDEASELIARMKAP